MLSSATAVGLIDIHHYPIFPAWMATLKKLDGAIPALVEEMNLQGSNHAS